MNRMLRNLAFGAAAGAAGTTALNAVTYLDMAIRGRPSSDTPAKTIEALSAKTNIAIPGSADTRDNRIAGLGPLAGLVTGVGSGVILAAARSAGLRPNAVTATAMASVLALLGSNAPMTALGVTDPRTWSVSSWISDIIPHLAYGAVTTTVLQNL